jgi:hypothetical protein
MARRPDVRHLTDTSRRDGYVRRTRTERDAARAETDANGDPDA